LVRVFSTHFPLRLLVLGATEAFLVCFAFVAAAAFHLGTVGTMALARQARWGRMALVISILLVCMYYLDLYEPQLLRNRTGAFVRLLQAVGALNIILAGVYYAYPSVQLDRDVLLVALLLVLLLLLCWRQLFFWMIGSLNIVQRVVIFDEGPLASALTAEVTQRPGLGFKLMGYVCDDPEDVGDLPYLGGPDRLRDIVQRYSIARIVIGMKDRRGKLPSEQLLTMKSQGVMVQDAVDFYESITDKIYLDSPRVSSLLFSSGFRVSRLMLVYKRVSSIVFSFIGLVLTTPLMAVTALAIKVDSPGAAILRQERVGKDGKVFMMYKFRTMQKDADRTAYHLPAQLRDNRVTRVGYWLRRTRIDELPQLYNILRGDMSFIGPRPFVPSQEERLAETIPLYRRRWLVKPGATGWAQTKRGYCVSLEDNIEKLAYDLYYIKNLSIGLDLLILAQTFKTLMFGRGSQ
jgi:sugar transferase (PEP-CTERM system associated)